MTIIRIEQNDNGSHDNQTILGVTMEDFPVPEGWAIVPDVQPLENFPFGAVTTEDVNGVPTVTGWAPLPIPEVPIAPEPVDPQADTDAMLVDLSYRLTMLELGL